MGDPGGRIYPLQEQGYFGQGLRRAQRTGEISCHAVIQAVKTVDVGYRYSILVSFLYNMLIVNRIQASSTN